MGLFSRKFPTWVAEQRRDYSREILPRSKSGTKDCLLLRFGTKDKPSFVFIFYFWEDGGKKRETKKKGRRERRGGGKHKKIKNKN